MRGSGTRGARGAVFRTRFRTPNHTRDAPHALRGKFGEIENFRVRNFGSEILNHNWSSLLLAARERHIEFFVEIFQKITDFECHTVRKRVRKTRRGPGDLSRWPLTLQHSPRLHNPVKSQKFTKNHQKSSKSKSGHYLTKQDFENVSRQQSSVLVDLITCPATIDY